MLLFASEVGLDIDENNIFLWIRPKMSMISIMWSLERSVMRPWLQGHHLWFTSEYHDSNGLSPWFLLRLRCRDRRCSCISIRSISSIPLEKIGGVVVLLVLLPPTLVNFKSSSFVYTAFQSSFDIIITFFVGCYYLYPCWIPLHTVQNMYQNSPPLQGSSNYLSNKWLFTPIRLRIKKLCSFYYGAAICPEGFQNAQRWKILP